jgi:hypothetical protein
MKLLLAIAAFASVGISVGAPAANASVHLASPLEVTQYFAAAVNNSDLGELHQVTTPASFKAVMDMRSYVRDVHAQSCTATGRGDYDCVLKYQYRHQQGTGQWTVIVAPADSPGWYVYQYVVGGCD